MRLAILLLLIAVPSWAQPMPGDLFTNLDRPAAGLATATQLSADAEAGMVISRVEVALRLDRLFSVAGGPVTRVRLNLGGTSWIARFERLDRDLSGFRSWVGVIEGVEHSHVVFTEREGIVSGLINAGSAIYRLRSVDARSYLLERLDTSRFRPEMEPIPRFEREIAVDLPTAGVPDDASTIDVLMLYTATARAKAGGLPQIQALASQVISDGNTIFSRSGVAARLRLVSATELTFAETPNLGLDLLALIDSTVARSFRDLTRADVVQLLVSSPESPACGVGALLSTPGATDFDAFSIADIACVAQYTPTHEIGHNLGSHHAPEDGASGALFPYSYGFKDSQRRFRTVMAFQCPGGPCPRIPHFSNPSVPFNGAPTGTPSQDNALSITNAAATVASWRQGGGTLTPPAAPTGLRSQTFGALVFGAWNAPANAFSYTLQIGSAPGAADVFSAPVGNTKVISGSVQPGRYFWRVMASNTAGESPPSAEAEFTVVTTCQPPGPPHSFAFAVDGRLVTLEWSAPSSGGVVAGYIVEAGSASGLANVYKGPTGSASPGAVTTAPPGTYFVRVRAQNACGTGGPSNEQVITVQ